MKKLLALVLAAVMLLSFAACGSNGDKLLGMSDAPIAAVEVKVDYEIPDDFKIGFICLHDENSTYDLNFLNAVDAIQAATGLKDEQVIVKTNIGEDDACYNTAKDLATQGCDIIFANSFGHEAFMIKAAKEFPEVQFCHATGTKAHTEGLDNYHNAFASIYEGRYLAGVAAGMKLKEMMAEDSTIVPKMGYVGAFTYAEVISGYTSFYLGAKSIVPEVTMDVQFTGSWYDPTEEKNAAEALIDKGCVLISQHADSMGAPGACEAAGVPNVSYNGATYESCPEGSVVLTGINQDVAAEGTADKIKDVVKGLTDGTIKVFDTKTFTVEGKELTSYTADVDDMGDYAPDTEVVEGGSFNESVKRSAPYFDLKIDGITRLNEKF